MSTYRWLAPFAIFVVLLLWLSEPSHAATITPADATQAADPTPVNVALNEDPVVKTLDPVARSYWTAPLPCFSGHALADSKDNGGGNAAAWWSYEDCRIIWNRAYLYHRTKRIRDYTEQYYRALDVCVTELHEYGHGLGFTHKDTKASLVMDPDADASVMAPAICQRWARAYARRLHPTKRSGRL